LIQSTWGWTWGLKIIG